MTNQPRAEISWTDSGVPVSTRFDDPYFSLASGVEETQHVFLAGNDLPQRSLAATWHPRRKGKSGLE